MTQEEKARAYDEALKDMRVIYPNLKGDAKLAVEHAFPQLAESEDERIRKWIIDELKICRGGHTLDGNKVFADKDSEAIAWLEKQKEKEKYDRMMPVYDNLDSFESALAKAWKAYNDSGARTVDGCEDDYVECAHAKGFREGYLFGFEKQKEQKPEWKPQPESLEALMYAIEGKWDMISPTSYLSRRLEDLYEGLVNTFNVDESLIAKLPKVASRAYTAEDIEELREMKRKIEASMEQKPAEWSDYKDKVNVPYCSSEPEWSEEEKEVASMTIVLKDYNDGTISCYGVDEYGCFYKVEE